MKKPINTSISELILSAVYFLQKKNGVSAKNITKYICNKRGLKQSKIKTKVKEALNRGTQNGVFNFKRGLYKVQADYNKKLTNSKKKIKKKSKSKKSTKRIARNGSVATDNKWPSFTSANVPEAALNNEGGMHSMSEDVFHRNARESSYFEASALGRPSDEEDFFDDDEEEDDEDDYSDTKENPDMDIYTVTVANEHSSNQFPKFSIYSAVRQKGNKKLTTKGKCRKKTANRKAKKRKMSKPRRSTRGTSPPKKPKVKESDDDDFFDEEDSDYFEDSDIEKTQYKKSKDESRPEAKESDKKSKPKPDEIKTIKDAKPNAEDKAKQPPPDDQKTKQKKRSESEECTMKENQDNLMKRDVSPRTSNPMVTSSAELLPSDLNLSLSSNSAVSDVKFSPTNLKFESQDSTTILFSKKMKKEGSKQQERQVISPKKDLFDDFEFYCECETYKRKNPTFVSAWDDESPQGMRNHPKDE